MYKSGRMIESHVRVAKKYTIHKGKVNYEDKENKEKEKLDKANRAG
jgi:hypothetical protein